MMNKRQRSVGNGEGWQDEAIIGLLRTVDGGEPGVEMGTLPARVRVAIQTIRSLIRENQQLSDSLAVFEAQMDTPSVTDVIAERHLRQTDKGWTAEHDDRYEDFQMAIAAACYAQNVGDFACACYPSGNGEAVCWNDTPEPEGWPWPGGWDPKSPRQDLVRAAALLLAEIDRLDRAELTGTRHNAPPANP